MDESKLKLLKFALKMGETAIIKLCDDDNHLYNEYYCMEKELAEMLDIGIEELTDE